MAAHYPHVVVALTILLGVRPRPSKFEVDSAEVGASTTGYAVHLSCVGRASTLAAAGIFSERAT